MDKIKLKKTLYIGLGGTGVATLLKVKKCFIDSYGEIPPMIGFLAIDTDTAASSKQDLSKTGGIIKLLPLPPTKAIRPLMIGFLRQM